MLPIIIFVVSVVILGIYAFSMKKQKLDTKTIVTISMICAISYMLYMIPLIRYPQGGGITFLSMMPIMILSIFYGPRIGFTAGIVFGLLKLLNGGTIMHPAQFMLDYILGAMALGVAGIFGFDNKKKMIMACLLAITLSTFSSVISGVVFFGQFAPENMNVWVYSLIYNVSSAGVEGIITTIVIGCVPLRRIAKALNLDIINKEVIEAKGIEN